MSGSALIFKELHGLCGSWKEEGGTTLVDFRLSVRDSILIETWTWPEKDVEALTIYFMDQQILKATHYCPIGNQPTLMLVGSDNDQVIRFEKESVTNLTAPEDDHNLSFWFRIEDRDAFVRSETYLANGAPEISENRYLRQ